MFCRLVIDLSTDYGLCIFLRVKAQNGSVKYCFVRRLTENDWKELSVSSKQSFLLVTIIESVWYWKLEHLRYATLLQQYRLTRAKTPRSMELIRWRGDCDGVWRFAAVSLIAARTSCDFAQTLQRIDNKTKMLVWKEQQAYRKKSYTWFFYKSCTVFCKTIRFPIP